MGLVGKAEDDKLNENEGRMKPNHDHPAHIWLGKRSFLVGNDGMVNDDSVNGV